MISNLPPGTTQEDLDAGLDSPEEIKAVTDEAIERGHSNANPEWKAMALECVKTICLQKETFTMNDVRWLVRTSPIKTHDNRAIGGVMKTAKSLGWIEPTGQSIVSKVGHKSLLQVWKSKIYKQTQLF